MTYNNLLGLGLVVKTETDLCFYKRAQVGGDTSHSKKIFLLLLKNEIVCHLFYHLERKMKQVCQLLLYYLERKMK